ncbi:MAG: 2-oxoacid:ferredoxin oxidoreductase subunit beta [Clostridia bacterium]|nr:2-oxoacid:ferredoxin oxidoreductase subunit beta [Clostridia bacterium]
MATLEAFKTDEKAWWCPGCGDFGVLSALQKALADLDLEPEKVALVAGIGCSGKIGNYVNSYNLHVTHGRTLPAALGLKLANPTLTVIAAGGDGDAFAIGMSHFAHAVRRNPDVTYIVMDNHIYGLTKGQNSPTSDPGAKSKASPWGNVEQQVHPLSLAISAGATFVAQGFSGNPRQLTRIIEEAIRHKGFSFVNAISPCVTFNRINTYDFYRKSLVDLEQDPEYRANDRAWALRKLLETDELVTGVVYRDDETLSLEERLPGFLEAKPIALRTVEELEAEKERVRQLIESYR